MHDLTHLDPAGRATMVDVSAKPETQRFARAQAVVRLSAQAFQQVAGGRGPKGDLFPTASLAGIQAAKRCSELVPLCHPLRLTNVQVTVAPEAARDSFVIEARVAALDRTGVEMEAMTAASVAALTLYDMIKAVDRFAVIERVQLMEKDGGKSGHVVRPGDQERT
jgi:cyclic pyranopterin phosphate synthase